MRGRWQSISSDLPGPEVGENSLFSLLFALSGSSLRFIFFSTAVGVVAPAGCRDERDLLVPGEQRGDPPSSPQRNDLRGPGRLRAHVAGENSGTRQDARGPTVSSSPLLSECSESQQREIISAVKGANGHTFTFTQRLQVLFFMPFHWCCSV